MFKKFRYTIGQVYESIVFALQSVIVNKMRTFLSLLGITIGIFSIISVYTAIDTLEDYIHHSLSAINSNQIQIGKWSWGPEEGKMDYPWWKYMNRPEVTENEFREIKSMMPGIKEAALQIAINRTVKYENNSLAYTTIIGGSESYKETRNTKVAHGRLFTPYEFEIGANSAVIGSTIAEELFGNADPIGKTIKVSNRKVEVVGVFEKEGKNTFGASWDEQIFLPLNFVRTLSTFRYAQPVIYVIPEPGQNLKDFKDLLRSKMRILRRLSPTAEDNFALNDVGTVTKNLDQIFVMINLAGGIIGLFSILVGGFGVANIMFVSVRERTAQIGIQKALGARPYSILLQFTIEAVLLSIVGGIVGLFLIWLLTLVASSLLDFEVVLSIKNILIGLGISSAVGAISGIFPAYSAATMDPVQAISKNA